MEATGIAMTDNGRAGVAAPNHQPTAPQPFDSVRGLRSLLHGFDTSQLRTQLVPGWDVERVDGVALVIVGTDLAVVLTSGMVIAYQERRSQQNNGPDVSVMWGINPNTLMPRNKEVALAELPNRLQATLSVPRSPDTEGYRVGVWDPTLDQLVPCKAELAGDVLRFYVPDVTVGNIQAAFGKAWLEAATCSTPS